jgi:hypothetical protein
MAGPGVRAGKPVNARIAETVLDRDEHIAEWVALAREAGIDGNQSKLLKGPRESYSINDVMFSLHRTTILTDPVFLPHCRRNRARACSWVTVAVACRFCAGVLGN